MIIDGEKWACEACVRGHRVSNCQHSGELFCRPVNRFSCIAEELSVSSCMHVQQQQLLLGRLQPRGTRTCRNRSLWAKGAPHRPPPKLSPSPIALLILLRGLSLVLTMVVRPQIVRFST